MAKRIGDTQLQSEKLPNEKNANITTHIDERNQITIATNIIIPTPTRSTLGGPITSSTQNDTSPRTLLFSNIIYKKNKTSTNTDKYIRKIKNSKVFYRDKVNNMTNKYAFICMGNSSCENQAISNIKNP